MWLEVLFSTGLNIEVSKWMGVYIIEPKFPTAEKTQKFNRCALLEMGVREIYNVGCVAYALNISRTKNIIFMLI